MVYRCKPHATCGTRAARNCVAVALHGASGSAALFRLHTWTGRAVGTRCRCISISAGPKGSRKIVLHTRGSPAAGVRSGTSRAVAHDPCSPPAWPVVATLTYRVPAAPASRPPRPLPHVAASSSYLVVPPSRFDLSRSTCDQRCI